MTATSSPTPEAARGIQGQPPGDRSRAFAAARRHSSRVKLLRWLVPLGAVGAVIVALAGWVGSLFQLPDIDVGDVALSDGQIAMSAPVLRGEDQDGRPYELTAREAFQTVSADPVIVLRDLTGTMAISDDDEAVLTAPQARFDSAANRIFFDEGGVAVQLASGARVTLGYAEIDLDAGTLTSDEPVDVVNDEVRLQAQAVRGLDGGKRLLFTGQVRMVITPAEAGNGDNQ